MKKLLTIVALTASLVGVSYSGEYCPTPSDKCPIESCDSCCEPLGFSAAFGYETDYMWRGFRFAEDSGWVDLSYSFGDFTVGTWAIFDFDRVFTHELDLYASYSLPSILGFDAEVGYTFYELPGDNGNEFYFALGRDLGFAELSLSTAYDVSFETWYHEAGLGKSFDLSDNVSLDLASGIGYWDFVGGDSGFSHYYVTAGLSFALNDCVTLSPYIGWTDSLEDGPIGTAADFRGTANDRVYGGISLSVDF